MGISKKVKPEVQVKVQAKEKPTGVTVKQAVKEKGTGKAPKTIKNERKKPEVQVKEKSADVTVKQVVKEEGTVTAPQPIKNEQKKPDGLTKTELAMKIMEQLWGDIQAGKIKRKDVIQRFIDEVGLTKAGTSTYYGNIKKKLSKVA